MIEFTCDGYPIETQQYLDIVEILNECPVEKDEDVFINFFQDYLSFESIDLKDQLNEYYHDVVFTDDISLTNYYGDNERITILNAEQSARVRKILG